MASTSKSANWSGDSRFSMIMNVGESYVSGGADNYSNVDWNIQLHSNSSWHTWDYTEENPLTVYVNGQLVFNQNISYDLYEGDTDTVASGTIRVPHNSDGSKNIGFSASFTDNGNYKGTASLSGDLTLTKIARKANVTGANNFNDEGTPTMTFSNPGGFTINAWLEPNPTGTHLCERNNIPNTGSYSWTLTEAERNQLRAAVTNSNECTIRFGLQTIIGGTPYSSYVDKKFSIINGDPVFTDFDFADINTTTVALTGSNKTNVNGYSNIKVTITPENKAVAQKGASIVKYRLTCGTNTPVEANYSDSSTVELTINGATSGTYKLLAIDNRGNSKSVEKVATNIINYSPIYINPSSSSAERDDSGVGEVAILDYKGTIWNDNFGQVANGIVSAHYEYKATDSNVWITYNDFVQAGVVPTDITPTLTNNTFRYHDNNGIRSIDAQGGYKFELQKSYDFRIVIADKLSTTTVQLTPMPSGTPNLCYADDGVAIMGDYNENLDSGLQVYGNLYVNGINILNSLYPVGSIYLSVNNTNPSTIFGGTWEQIKDRFLLAAGNTYTAGNTGGEASHTLTIDEMPSHSHQQKGYKMFARQAEGYAVAWEGDDDPGGSYTRNTGGGQAHNNMPPYLVVYMWKRTA